MTERDWLTSTDPVVMFGWLQRGQLGNPGVHPLPSARKLRLLAVACCYQVWGLLTDERSRRAVEVACRYADGEATEAELQAAYDGASAAGLSGEFAAELAWKCAHNIDGLTANAGLPRWFSVSTKFAALQAALLRDIFGNPWRPVVLPRAEFLRFDGLEVRSTPILSRHAYAVPNVLSLARAAYEDRVERTCGRCGGEGKVPHYQGMYRLGSDPCPLCAGTGRTGLVLDPGTLGALHDALIEAGCPETVECPTHCKVSSVMPGGLTISGCVACGGTGRVPNPLLAHLLEPGPHVRGCWAVDLLTGRV